MTVVVSCWLRTGANQISSNARLALEKLRNICLPDEHHERMHFLDIMSIATPETISPKAVSDKVITDLNRARAPGESVFIDVGGPDFDETVPTKIADFLTQVVTDMELRQSRVAILMQRQHLETDRFLRRLEIVCSGCRAVIVYADTGNVFNLKSENSYSLDHRQEVLEWCSSVRLTNKQALQRKLIRHRGFYRLPIGSKTTVSVFDGRNCVGEITELIATRLSAVVSETEKIHVLVDDKNSRWLGEAATNAQIASQNRILVYRTSEIGSSSLPIEIDAVLFSVIRTGKAVETLMCDSRYKIKAEALLWALVSLEKTLPTEVDNHVKVISSGSGELYSVNVEIVRDSADDELLQQLWANSTVSPFPINEISLRDQFRSDEIWSLLLESGLKPEDDIPDSRTGYHWVPDMTRFVSRHGPLLAGKISASLAATGASGDGAQGTFFFVHPMESAAKSLVDYLCGMTEKRSIGISRNLINAVSRSDDYAALEALARREDFLPELSRLSQIRKVESLSTIYIDDEPVKVVLIDEFAGSGDTLYHLKRLCRWLQWEVRSAVCPVIMGRHKGKAALVDHFYYQFGSSMVLV
ncbi:hypothetical protein ACC806_03915 [Rhizobium ruizarguesonis]